MKYLLIGILILATIVACTKTEPAPTLVGADKDEHGCIGSAGYSWCEEKQKCLRSWEETCEATTTTPTTPTTTTPTTTTPTTTTPTTPTAPETIPDTTAQTCTAQWECKNATAKIYKYESCRFGAPKACPGGCDAGECLEMKAPTTTTITRQPTTDVWECKTPSYAAIKSIATGQYINATFCKYGCKDGKCK